MPFFPCLFHVLPLFHSEMTRRTTAGPRHVNPYTHLCARQSLPPSLPCCSRSCIHAAPSVQLPSDSPSLSCSPSLLLSGLTAVLYWSHSHQGSPNRCCLSSLLAEVGKGHWHGKAERVTSDVISYSHSCSSSLWTLASQDNRETCAYGIRQPVHLSLFLP